MALGRKTKDANRKRKKVSVKQVSVNLMTSDPSATKKRQLPSEDEDCVMTCGPPATKKKRISVDEMIDSGTVTCAVCETQDGSQNSMLCVVPIKGDGNCLFRAISHCIHKDQRYFNSVRKHLLLTISRHIGTITLLI